MKGIRYVAALSSALSLVLALAPVSRAQTPYATGSPEPAVIEGQVAAASESGELLLRTDKGMVAFLVPPEEIQGVSIGQTVQVPLADDENSK
jgi:hypothetical protein